MRTRKYHIFTIEIFGYGINATILTGDHKNNDGSLSKYGIKGFWGRWSNPSITFIIFYSWITFRLLLNRE